MTFLAEIKPLITGGVVAMILVFLAIGIDLVSGIRKAIERGERRNSYALSRTLTKFVLYEGGALIALCIDILIHIAHIYALIGADVLSGAPLVCCLACIFLLFVEGLSVREKADEKMRKQFKKAREEATHIVQDKTVQAVAQALAPAIANAIKQINSKNE